VSFQHVDQSPLQFRATARFRLARLGLLLCALTVIVLIAATGAGTEGQPGLLAFLLLVVGVFVVVGAIVAVAGWRLQVILDGQLLTVRSLRTRTIDLSKVERVGSRSVRGDGPAVVFAETTGTPGRHRLLTLPTGAVVAGVVWPAWRPEDARVLFPAALAALPADATFDENAIAPFARAGCDFHQVS
jgi:hypothetical protein